MSDTPPPPPPSDVPPPPSAPNVPPPPPPVSQPAGAWIPTAGRSSELGKRRSVGMTILLSIVTCGIWTFVWSYKTGDELKRWSGDGLGGVAYLLITIFISPVTMFLMANEVEQLYRKENREPPITTIWGLWFLLPIIGLFVWYIRIQNAINDYWTMHGQTNDPSL
jgi:hypothetical protein